MRSNLCKNKKVKMCSVTIRKTGAVVAGVVDGSGAFTSANSLLYVMRGALFGFFVVVAGVLAAAGNYKFI